MTVRIRIRANNPRLHNFISKFLPRRGNLKIGEIFHGYRTNIIIGTIDSDPISMIWLDLGEKLA